MDAVGDDVETAFTALSLSADSDEKTLSGTVVDGIFSVVSGILGKVET